MRGRLLQHAGLALPVADIESTIVRYEHPLGLMDELRKQGATNPMIELPHKATSRKLLGQVINNYLDKNQDPDGRVRATLELIWLSAWAPHESQQKPLAPGSAKMSLKDALEKKKLARGYEPSALLIAPPMLSSLPLKSASKPSPTLANVPTKSTAIRVAIMLYSTNGEPLSSFQKRFKSWLIMTHPKTKSTHNKSHKWATNGSSAGGIG